MLAGSAALLVLAGCGRNGLSRRDAGAADAEPDGGGGGPDVADAVLGDGKPDLADALLGDGAPDVADASTFADVRIADAPLPDVVVPALDLASDPPNPAVLSCASLRPLVEKGVLTNRHVRQVRFAPDGKALLLQVVGGDASGSDEALVVGLPGGEQHTFARGMVGAEWLTANAVLVTMADASLQLFPAAVTRGSDIRSLVLPNTCGHVAAPDGSRLYYTHDCSGGAGDLSVLDLVGGTRQELGTSVSTSGMVVSPGGRWAAYLVSTGPTDASPSSTAVHVVEKGGTPYAVPVAESAWNPAFLSDEILLVETAGPGYLDNNIWGHHPGTSDVRLLTHGDHGFPGYQANADQSGFLLAKLPSSSSNAGELYLARVADGSLVQLASDLMDFGRFAMRIQAFAIVPASQRVVYLADVSSEAGGTYRAASVAQDGQDRVPLAADASRIVVSAYGDRVAVIATDRTDGASGHRATIASATTGAQQARSEAVSSIQATSFVPGDRGVLFVDKDAAGKAWRLHYLSFAAGVDTTLAEWTTSQLLPYAAPTGIDTQTYPIDPTGCFVPVDSDLDPVGTRLVLLPE
jgi:hypothetical protein